MSKYLCVYHGGCADGFGAAWAVRHWLRRNDALNHTHDLPDAEFIPVQYGDAPPDVTGKRVFIVDFSYPRVVLDQMAFDAELLIIIDHHASAQKELAGFPNAIFDMDKCGCVLTWEHLFPTLLVPAFFLYLQDRDLWQWKLPYSREISAGLRSYPFDFDLWDQWCAPGRIVFNDLIEGGAAILRYQEQCIASALAHPPAMIEIGGYTVPCVNSTHLISEIGNLLAKGHPFAALYFDTGDGKRVFSLRSTEDGVDVSEVARQYAGGGHHHAAGFTIPGPPVLHPIL